MGPLAPAPTELPEVAPSTGAATAWRIGASVLAVAALAFGALHVVGLLAHEERTEAFVVDDPAVAELDVRSDGGHVEVVGDDVDEISVTARISDGLQPTGFSHRVVGDRLELEVTCRSGLANPWCRVGLTVVVPRDLELVVSTADGASVRDLDGAVEVHSDNGTIAAEGLRGAVRLSSDNGSVRGLALGSERIEASSSNGSVDLELATSPRSVTATSDNGSVEVALPRSDVFYAVDAASSNGSVDNQIRTDPAGTRRILARTDNGSVTLRYLS